MLKIWSFAHLLAKCRIPRWNWSIATCLRIAMRADSTTLSRSSQRIMAVAMRCSPSPNYRSLLVWANRSRNQCQQRHQNRPAQSSSGDSGIKIRSSTFRFKITRRNKRRWKAPQLPKTAGETSRERWVSSRSLWLTCGRARTLGIRRRICTKSYPIKRRSTSNSIPYISRGLRWFRATMVTPLIRNKICWLPADDPLRLKRSISHIIDGASNRHITLSTKAVRRLPPFLGHLNLRLAIHWSSSRWARRK